MSKLNLNEFLRTAGIRLTAKAFRSRLIEIFDELHPDMTEDDLVCFPRRAIHFCDVVRERLNIQCEDYPILKTLMNVRKRGLSRKARMAMTDQRARKLLS